jgi:hypothetical protein
VVQHRLESLSGYVARSGAVEVIADFLVVGGNSFGHRAGSASYYKEPAGDFLSGADFGEGTEGGWIKIQGEGFVVSVEFVGGRHNEAPVGKPSKKARSVRDALAKLGARGRFNPRFCF